MTRSAQHKNCPFLVGQTSFVALWRLPLLFSHFWQTWFSAHSFDLKKEITSQGNLAAELQAYNFKEIIACHPTLSS